MNKKPKTNKIHNKKSGKGFVNIPKSTTIALDHYYENPINYSKIITLRGEWKVNSIEKEAWNLNDFMVQCLAEEIETIIALSSKEIDSLRIQNILMQEQVSLSSIISISFNEFLTDQTNFQARVKKENINITNYL